MAAKEYDYKGFDRVQVNGIFDLRVVRSGTFQVSIESDPLKHIYVYKEGDTLRIGISWYTYLWWFLTWWNRPRAYISLPELREVRASGACHGEVGDFSTTHDFSLEIAGASSLELDSIKCGNADIRVRGASQLEFKGIKGAKGDVDILGASRIEGELELTGDVRFDIAGASRVELSGKASDANINFSGASQGKLEGFKVHNAKVRLVGASNAVVNVEHRLDIDASGASNISWVGNPTMGDIRSRGASTLHKA